MARDTALAKQAAKPAQTLEWVLAAIAAMVVTTILCFLVLEAVTKSGHQPDLRLQVVEVREVDGRFFVDVLVDNRGYGAAADVEVLGATGAQGQAVRALLDYAPPESGEIVTLGFVAPVQASELELRVGGYREP
jgi:uncharacterized protein (TIGR02588 family)